MGILDLPSFLTVVAVMVGATIGSFLNVVIYRVPLGLSVNEPRRSFCPACNYAIPYYYNIPLVSWLMLRGKCKNCGGGISFRYFFVELLTAMLFVAVWLTFGWYHAGGIFLYPALVPVGWILLALFICATFIDIDHQIIPDGITIGGTLTGLVAAFVVPAMAPVFMDCGITGIQNLSSRFQSLGWSALGAGCGFGLLYAVVIFGKLAFGRKNLKLPEDADWRVSQEKGEDNPTFTAGKIAHPWEELYFVGSERVQMQCSEVELNGEKSQDVGVQVWFDKVVIAGRETPLEDIKALTGRASGGMRYHREAMGFGDVKFMALVGAFLGWKAVLFTVLVASIAGTAVALPGRILGKGGAFSRIPFGPYLAMGATLWLFFGPRLVDWYFGLMRGGLPG